MKMIFIDLETFNPEPKAINNGAAKYSEAPSLHAWLTFQMVSLCRRISMRH